MKNLSNPTLHIMFRVLIILATLISLYLLFTQIYYKNYKSINAWQFPMLLAILVELYL